MSYSITQLKSDLEPMLHGTTLDEVPNIDSVISRCARQLLHDVDPQETIRKSPMSSAIFGETYVYPAPTDLKTDKVIDIRPQVNRKNWQNPSQTFSRNFDLNKDGQQMLLNVDYNTGVKTLNISIPPQTALVVNNADDITDNGTWAVTANATNLTEDTLNYVAGNSSLRFDISSGSNPTTGYIENSTMDEIDISTYDPDGTVFMWVYLPTASDFTSVNLRIGSSSSDYYSGSVATSQGGVSFVNGWNLLAFKISQLSETGTVDPTAIDYIRVTFTTDGTAQTSVRVNGITVQLGAIYEIEYYSNYLFRDYTTGAWKETVTDDSDFVNLETSTYNLLLDLTALTLVQQLQGQNGMFDYGFLQKKYNDSLMRYKAMYKSQVLKPTQKYYNRTTNHFRSWFGRR